MLTLFVENAIYIVKSIVKVYVIVAIMQHFLEKVHNILTGNVTYTLKTTDKCYCICLLILLHPQQVMCIDTDE
jgi:hypothetical protein